MAYAGYFINLDRSAARRARLLGMFERYGAGERYQRFAAVDGQSVSGWPQFRKRGELGCYLSHLQLLRSRVGAGEATHVIEDDAAFHGLTASLIGQAVERDILGGYDLVFTSTVSPFEEGFNWYCMSLFDQSVVVDAKGDAVSVSALTIVDLAQTRFVTTTSYLALPASIDRVVASLEAELERGEPIDLTIQRLALSGRLRCGVTIPFLTVTDPETALGDGSIEHGHSPHWRIAHHALEQAFFVGRDVDRVRALLEPRATDKPATATARLIAESFAYLLKNR